MFDAAAEVAADLGKIQCPVLLFSSRQDHVVPTSSGDRVAADVAGPVERVWLERSYHVATLDWDREEVESRAAAFAGTVLGAA
jgi:carboxylesterase